MAIGYLGGPIANCNDDEAITWRNSVKSRTSVDWHDPMDRDFRFYHGKIDVNGIENRSESSLTDEIVNIIVEGDKAAIENSNFCLYNFWKLGVGTSMEIIYSWNLGKQNIIVVPPGVSISPWIRYHAHQLFTSLDEAVDYINKVW